MNNLTGIIYAKDNPVPSIDKTIDWLLLLNVPQVFTHDLRQKIIENLEELQNGVESNKEQPECSCSKPHYGFKTITVCTDCDGIKDDEYWKKLKG